MRLKLTMDDNRKILRKRNLGDGEKAQQFFGNEIARLSDKYVPLRAGPLKNTVMVLNGGRENVYPQPYASAQWYSPRKPGSATGPLRGPKWTYRMWAAEGREIKSGLAKITGGKVT